MKNRLPLPLVSKTILLLAIAAVATAQTAYFRIVRAELPWYPPLARAAMLGGTVNVEVTVRQGEVTEATFKSGAWINFRDRQPTERPFREEADVFRILVLPSIANVKTWRFANDPNGTFVATYIYKIGAFETKVPENPKIEFNFPKVTITTNPLSIDSK